MALYGPFYAGKNAPLKVKYPTKKSNPVLRKTMKSRKTMCSNAAKTLSKCRGDKRNSAQKQICKNASMTLRGCRKPKKE